MNDHFFFEMQIMIFLKQCADIISFVQAWFVGIDSQVSDMAQGPLVFLFDF